MLAKWLKGVTLAVAEANPNDEHSALFGLETSRVELFVLCVCFSLWDTVSVGDRPRLRASLFVNLVAMRSCLSKDRNPGALLTPENRSILVRSNFLLHSAHSCHLTVSGCYNGGQERFDLV